MGQLYALGPLQGGEGGANPNLLLLGLIGALALNCRRAPDA